jgi:KaiC/GvpD/RAD55 family RecA-like ATPase
MVSGALYRGLLVTIVLILIAGARPMSAAAVSTPPPVERVFYFTNSNPRGLTATPPVGGPAANVTFPKTPIEFVLSQPLLYSATISGSSTFSLFLISNQSTPVSVSVIQIFKEKFLGGSSSNVTSQSQRYTLAPGLNNASFIFNIPQQPLVVYSQISVAVTVTNIPQNTFVSLMFGSAQAPSKATLPFSGYVALDPTTPITTLDRSQTPTASFNQSASIGNDVIILQAHVFSSFGLSDIEQGGRVNMTIIDPGLRPVKGATNVTMTQFPAATTSTPEPYVYTTTWVFPSNATIGVYQIFVDIFDTQHNHAFSFRGPASFNIFKPGFSLPPPFSLLPYFAVAGAGVAGVAVYYSRRKAKNYLAPFDHFNALTRGELDSGTITTIEGNTGSGKTLLSEQLMYEDLKKGRPCVYVATSDFPSNIRTSMKSMGLDVTGYEQRGMLTFVDGYSSEAGQGSTEKFVVPSLGDLTTLGVKISSSLPPSAKGASLYFDSLVPLASKAKPESIISFVQTVGAKMRGIGGKAFFTVGHSVDGMVQRQLEDMADCVVQMEAFEERGARRRRLKIAKFRARRHQEGWNVFAIEDGKGIIFYSKRPRKL